MKAKSPKTTKAPPVPVTPLRCENCGADRADHRLVGEILICPHIVFKHAGYDN